MTTTYVLTISIPDRRGSIRVDPCQSLRALLKLAGRNFGVRCESIAEVARTTAAPTTPTQEAADHA